MNKLKDIIQIGLLDLKSHKKNNIISLILVFMSLVIYIGVNSHINSLQDNVNGILNCLDSRLLIGWVEEGKEKEAVKELKSLFGNDERIREITVCTLGMDFKWHDTEDILYTDSGNVMVLGCYEAVLDYNYKGEKKIPNENEVILPRYLYEIGIYDEKNIGNTDDLIGKNIKLSYETPNGMFKEKFEFKVIGTYDNIKSRASNCIFFVNHEIPVRLHKLRLDEEEENVEELKLIFNDPEYEVSREQRIGIYVTEGYDREEVLKEIEKVTEGKMHFSEYKVLDPSLEGYWKYVIQVGNIVSVMLLLISVINIAISSINEVKNRKWEMALKMAMGYTQSKIICIFFVEKLANMIKALLLALFVVSLYCIGLTYISNNYLEYWKREYVYMISVENVFVAVILVFMAGMIGMLAGRMAIKNINVSENLKLGE